MPSTAIQKTAPEQGTDPTGEFAFVIPWLIKAGTEAAVDALMQATINYFFDPNISTVSEAFSSIDWWQVGWAGATGLIPGGGLARAALVAAGDVVIEAIQAWSRCEEYTPQQALFTFAVGVASEFIGEKLGDLLVKYGTPVVAAGLKKLGFDDMAERLLRNADEAVEDVVDGAIDSPNFFSGFKNGTGFSAAFDSKRGKIFTKPSTYDLPPHSGVHMIDDVEWVPANGGHIQVGQDAVRDGSQSSDLWGFALVYEAPKTINVISWKSIGLNSQHGEHYIPDDIQQKILTTLQNQLNGWTITANTK